MGDLTDAALRALRPPETGRLEVRDTQVRGLVLRLTPKGNATWSVRARTSTGKHTRPRLGTWPAIGIKDARKRALEALGAIQGGADPVAEKKEARAARAARAGEPTVSERLLEWQSARAEAWSDRYTSEVKRICKREIEGKLGKRALIETTRADWTSLISAKHRKTASVGSMLYRTASSFLQHAEAHGWIPLPLLPRKGASIIAPTVAPRERVLTDVELQAIWRAADREAPKLRAFVRLAILTAARETEVADISAGEVDLEADRWSIPPARAKNGLGIVLPLGSLGRRELRAVFPNEVPAAGHFLLGRSPTNGFKGFSNLKGRIDAASGVEGWRWHDLRRTARTRMTALGVPRDHAEAAINHVSGRSRLVRTYDRHDYAPEVIAALERWQAFVAELVA